MAVREAWTERAWEGEGMEEKWDPCEAKGVKGIILVLKDRIKFLPFAWALNSEHHSVDNCSRCEFQQCVAVVQSYLDLNYLW